MAIFEVQLESTAFLRAQRARLKSQGVCPPPSITLPGGLEIQIQRVEFGANELRHGPERTWDIRYIDNYYGSPPQWFYWTEDDADGFSVHMAQEVLIHTSSRQAVLDHPNAAPPQLDEPIRVRPVFEIDYYRYFDEGCLLKTRRHHVEWPVEPDFLGLPAALVKQEIEKYLPQAFPAQSVPFNFTQFVPKKEFPEVANAGVSLSADGRILAFRTDPIGMSSPSSERPWTDFFHGRFESRLVGQDWALFTDGRVLRGVIPGQVESALRRKPIPHVTLSAASADFTVVNGKPVLLVHVGVNADAVFGDEYFDFNIVCTISLDPEPPALVMDIDLSDIREQTRWAVQFFDSLRWMFPPLAIPLELAIGEKIERLRGLPGRIAIQSNEFVCERINESLRRCRREAEIPSVPNVRLTATSVGGFLDGVAGMAINGRIEGDDPIQGRLAVEAGKFRWSARRVSCGSPEKTIQHANERPQDFAYLYLEHELKVEGEPPTSDVHFCSWEVINDPDNLYPKGSPEIVVQSDMLPTKLTVTMNAGQTLPNYPLDIIVRTTGGVQLIRAAAPEPFSEGDAMLVRGAVRAQMQACPMMPAWWDAIGDGFDLAWIEDPLTDPDPDLIVAHQVELRTLGDAVPLRARLGGAGFTRDIESAGDSANLSVMLPRSAQLTLRSADRPEAQDSSRSTDRMAPIDLQLRPLLARSRLYLGEPVRRITLFRSTSAELALVATPSQLLLLDITWRVEPEVRRRLHLPDARGAVATDDGILAWTGRKTTALSGDLCVSQSQPRIDTVRDAVALGGRIYAASADGITILDPDGWRRIGRVKLEGITCLLTSAGCLFAGGEFGIAVAEPPSCAQFQFRRIGAQLSAKSLHRGFGARETVVVRDDRGAETEFALEGAEFRICSQAKGEPVFTAFDVLGDTLAYSDAATGVLIVAEFGQARPAVPRLPKREPSSGPPIHHLG